MKIEGKNIVVKFLKRWQAMLILEMLIYALGAAVLVYFVSQDLVIAVGAFLITAAVAAVFLKPWQPNLQATSSYLDVKLESAEYSSGLLLASQDTLSDLAKLQQLKVSKQLGETISEIQPPNHLSRSIITAAALILLGFLFYQFNLTTYFQSPQDPLVPANAVNI